MKIDSLKKVLKGPILWIVLLLILAFSIYVVSAFKQGIVEAANFRDRVIKYDYEGTQQETSGFINLLTPEIFRDFNPESNEEQTIFTEIKKGLIEKRKLIEQIGQNTTPIKTDIDLNNLHLEKIESADHDTLISLMDPKYSKQLTINNLDMEEKQLDDHFPRRLYLQTSKDVSNPKSFVFLPVYLVGTSNGKPMIYETIQQELIFSKMIENSMENILKEFEQYNIRQVYFIPLSGFLRVMNTFKEKSHYDYYKQSFKGMLIFADRPYFREALKLPDLFRRSNPYIDTGGFGVVITYSIIIKNEKLGIMGMIGVDRQLDIKKFLEKTRVGFPSLGKDFRYGYHWINDKDISKKFSDPKLQDVISEIVNYPDKQFSRKIGKEDESSAFAFKINEKEIAWFVFNPREVKEKYNLILLIYIIFIAGISILILAVLFSTLSAFKAEKIHAEVVNHLNGGLLIVDENGKIKFHNHKFSDIIKEKYPKEKDFIATYLTDESQAEYHDKRQKLGSEFEFAGRIKRADSAVSPAIIASSAIAYPGVYGAQMFIIIPSEQLERTIGARFIHRFSHSLKTPASSILLLTDLMRRKTSQPKMEHYFSLMRQQVKEFHLMVTNFLGMSRGELQKTPPIKTLTNIATILRVAVKSFKEKAEKKNLELVENIPERLPAMVDPSMLQVILNNLLENCVKYTSKGKIIVDAHEETNMINISFGDTGIGIPDDEKGLIFEEFYRGRALEVQKQDGVGIGLYVSKLYIELHGGTIQYKPMIEEKTDKKGNVIKKEVGSQFIIKVPKE